MIRQELAQEIEKAINKTGYFNINDFSIETKPVGTAYVKLVLKYNYDDKYKIELNIPNTKSVDKSSGYDSFNYGITGNMCPGELAFNEEIFFRGGSKELVESIINWLEYLRSDLFATPANRLINEQKEELSKFEEKLSKIPDDYMTKQEIQDYLTRLDELESTFKEHLQKQIDNETELNQQIKSLQKEIEMLKNNAKTLKRRAFIRSVLSKIISWSANPTNQKLLKTGAQAIKPLLPEAVKGVIPDDKTA